MTASRCSPLAEHVRGAVIRVRTETGIRCPDDCCLPAHRYGGSEQANSFVLSNYSLIEFEVVFQPFAGLTKTHAAPFWYVLPTVANIAPISARLPFVNTDEPK